MKTYAVWNGQAIQFQCVKFKLEWYCMEGVASCSNCVQDDRHVMWSMLTCNAERCSCLYMHSAVEVSLS